MKNYLKKITLETKKQFEIIDITDRVRNALDEAEIASGLATVFCPHTTATIRLNHNEPLLMQDIMKAVYRLAPVDVSYSHDLFEIRQKIASNERSNGHAHVKAFCFGSSETIIVENSALLLGDKQSIFFVEFDGSRTRQVYVKAIGE